MKKKLVFHSELAYIMGIITLAFGTALMERADFGMSMVVAPAYLLHLKLSQTLPFFTFGIAEYCLQAIVLIVLAIVLRQIKSYFFLSFATTILYGVVLDWNIKIVALIPLNNFTGRILFFIFGMLFCCMGVSLFFHTYISPEAYELFVKEISRKYKVDINKTKTIYDCSSCLLAILMSFLFFGLGQFRGINVGTIICALFNGTCIGMFSKFFETIFTFQDALKLRQFYEN